MGNDQASNRLFSQQCANCPSRVNRALVQCFAHTLQPAVNDTFAADLKPVIAAGLNRLRSQLTCEHAVILIFLNNMQRH